MIKKIKQNKAYQHRHQSDVERIQQVCMRNGYEADLEDCAGIWDDYSDMYAAGWLGLPDDNDELWQIIEQYVKEKAV